MIKKSLILIILGIIIITIAIIGYNSLLKTSEEKTDNDISIDISSSGTNNNSITLYEFGNDSDYETDYYNYLKIYQKSFKEGDKVNITGDISSVSYNSVNDTTKISLGSCVGEWKLSCIFETYVFQGNLSGLYEKDDKVMVTGVIKRVIFSDGGFDYDLEIFEDQWQNISYFNNSFEGHPMSYYDGLANYQRGFKPMSSDKIKKID